MTLDQIAAYLFPALLNLLLDSLAFGAVFMYGTTGEILTEKAGHLNLGIPGIMCMGGAGGCLVLNIIGRSSLPGFLIVVLGILASFTAAGLMGLIYCFLTVTLRANQNVTGLAMTTFGQGLMTTIMFKLSSVNYQIVPLNYFRWPFAGRTDKLMLFGPMFFLAIIVAVGAGYFLTRTKTGLHLRAVGETPATADAVGINVIRYKYVTTIIGSGIAGLGGLYYIMDYMGSPEAYKRLDEFGWLSIALVIFVLWKPIRAIPGALIFGFLYTCSSLVVNMLRDLFGLELSTMYTQMLKMLPYVVTIVVLIINSISKKRENQPPASLGLSYFREDR